MFVIVKMGLEKRKNVSKMIKFWIPSCLNLGTWLSKNFVDIQVFDLCSLHSELCEFLF
jgi:hypothetical protein